MKKKLSTLVGKINSHKNAKLDKNSIKIARFSIYFEKIQIISTKIEIKLKKVDKIAFTSTNFYKIA